MGTKLRGGTKNSPIYDLKDFGTKIGISYAFGLCQYDLRSMVKGESEGGPPGFWFTH